MNTSRPDALDLRLLSILQENGRISNRELADRVNMTAAPCLRRRTYLERNGYIVGYHARLDPKRLGYSAEAYVFVCLDQQTRLRLTSFAEHVRALSFVRDCYILSGHTDALLRCVASDLQSLQWMVADHIAGFSGVSNVRVQPVVRHSVEKPGVDILDKQ